MGLCDILNTEGDLVEVRAGIDLIGHVDAKANTTAGVEGRAV